MFVRVFSPDVFFTLMKFADGRTLSSVVSTCRALSEVPDKVKTMVALNQLSKKLNFGCVFQNTIALDIARMPTSKTDALAALYAQHIAARKQSKRTTTKKIVPPPKACRDLVAAYLCMLHPPKQSEENKPQKKMTVPKVIVRVASSPATVALLRQVAQQAVGYHRRYCREGANKLAATAHQYNISPKKSTPQAHCIVCDQATRGVHLHAHCAMSVTNCGFLGLTSARANIIPMLKLPVTVSQVREHGGWRLALPCHSHSEFFPIPSIRALIDVCHDPTSTMKPKITTWQQLPQVIALMRRVGRAPAQIALRRYVPNPRSAHQHWAAAPGALELVVRHMPEISDMATMTAQWDTTVTRLPPGALRITTAHIGECGFVVVPEGKRVIAINSVMGFSYRYVYYFVDVPEKKEEATKGVKRTTPSVSTLAELRERALNRLREVEAAEADVTEEEEEEKDEERPTKRQK